MQAEKVFEIHTTPAGIGWSGAMGAGAARGAGAAALAWRGGRRAAQAHRSSENGLAERSAHQPRRGCSDAAYRFPERCPPRAGNRGAASEMAIARRPNDHSFFTRRRLGIAAPGSGWEGVGALNAIAMPLNALEICGNRPASSVGNDANRLASASS